MARSSLRVFWYPCRVNTFDQEINRLRRDIPCFPVLSCVHPSQNLSRQPPLCGQNLRGQHSQHLHHRLIFHSPNQQYPPERLLYSGALHPKVPYSSVLSSKRPPTTVAVSVRHPLLHQNRERIRGQTNRITRKSQNSVASTVLGSCEMIYIHLHQVSPAHASSLSVNPTIKATFHGSRSPVRRNKNTQATASTQ